MFKDTRPPSSYASPLTMSKFRLEMLLPKGYRTEKLPGRKEPHLLMRIGSQDNKGLSVEYLDPEYVAEGPCEVDTMNIKREQMGRADQNTKDARKEVTDLENSQPPLAQ